MVTIQKQDYLEIYKLGYQYKLHNSDPIYYQNMGLVTTKYTHYIEYNQWVYQHLLEDLLEIEGLQYEYINIVFHWNLVSILREDRLILFF